MAQAKKGIFNIPTGGGKTRVMSDMVVKHASGKTGVLVVVATPRIALTSQISKEFFEKEEVLRDGDVWKHQCYHSGDDVTLGLVETADQTFITSSFDVVGITTWLKSGRNAVVYTTYHSLEKLIEELKVKEIRPSILFCDEAHNLVTSEWNRYCDPTGVVSNSVDVMAFFTATNKTTRHDKCGMDDKEWFGGVVHRTDPRDLICRGIILPPRMITAEISVNIKKEDEAGKYSNADAMKIVEETLEVFTKEHSHGAIHKVIVTCDTADQARWCADSTSEKLDELGYKRFLVLSDVNKIRPLHLMPIKELDAFRAYPQNAIIFQYDIISEGIDVPGITAILLLRGVGDIKVVQTIGRTLRLDPSDRSAIKAGVIKPGDFSSLWKKPYGSILVPVNHGDVVSETKYRTVGGLVQAIRSHGFNFDVEEIICLSKPTSQDQLLDIDTLDPQKQNAGKEAIEAIKVTAEELNALEVGYQMRAPEVDVDMLFGDATNNVVKQPPTAIQLLPTPDDMAHVEAKIAALKASLEK
jgi:superfamily II DNA or RNA helicase